MLVRDKGVGQSNPLPQPPDDEQRGKRNLNAEEEGETRVIAEGTEFPKNDSSSSPRLRASVVDLLL